MKKILFNCSTNVVGGAIQNAYNFILNAIGDNEIDWLFLVSPQINEQLKKSDITDNRIIVIEKTPAKNNKSRKELLKHEQIFQPDIVYTIAGPAYVNFKTKHVMGLSNAYLTHANFRTFFFGRSLKESIQKYLSIIYKSFFARKANFFFFQTESSRNSFCKRFMVNKKRTAIVPNAIGKIFSTNNQFDTNNLDKNKSIQIFCPAAAYSHKSLHLIPRIAKILNKNLPEKDFSFTVTLQKESAIWQSIENEAIKLNVLHLIKNIGPFDYKDAPILHAESDIIFIPSVLETLSTSYLEGITSKKPMLVSNLPFAREICGNHALYFKPYSVKSAASQIENIILKYNYFLDLFSKSNSILSQYGNQEKRYNTIKKQLIALIEK